MEFTLDKKSILDNAFIPIPKELHDERNAAEEAKSFVRWLRP